MSFDSKQQYQRERDLEGEITKQRLLVANLRADNARLREAVREGHRVLFLAKCGELTTREDVVATENLLDLTLDATDSKEWLREFATNAIEAWAFRDNHNACFDTGEKFALARFVAELDHEGRKR